MPHRNSPTKEKSPKREKSPVKVKQNKFDLSDSSSDNALSNKSSSKNTAYRQMLEKIKQQNEMQYLENMREIEAERQRQLEEEEKLKSEFSNGDNDDEYY